jgi:hypothetical protein
MSTIQTSAVFKERFPYLIMALLFTFGVVFCIINTYEFVKLYQNDPNDDLEVSHSYTWFLIVCNGLFAFLFLLLLIMSVYLAVNPRGNNWATKILEKLKVFRSTSADFRKSEQQKILDNYNPTFSVSTVKSKDSLRGPKITYTCPGDKETPIPVFNEPIKRITFGDFQPYEKVKAENFSTPSFVKAPLTLDSLKDYYLSKKT